MEKGISKKKVGMVCPALTSCRTANQRPVWAGGWRRCQDLSQVTTQMGLNDQAQGVGSYWTTILCSSFKWDSHPRPKLHISDRQWANWMKSLLPHHCLDQCARPGWLYMAGLLGNRSWSPQERLQTLVWKREADDELFLNLFPSCHSLLLL